MAEGAIPRAARRGELCPSCERFIGPADVCPYCGADSAKSPLLRMLRWYAVILAVAGLVFLFLMAVPREATVVSIGDITPFMNFGRVAVSGKVTREPYVSNREGKVDYVSFLIDDGSGQMRVAAEDAVAESFVAGRRLPAKGAQIQATGILSVSAEGLVRLRLMTAEDLLITRAASTNRASVGDSERPPPKGKDR